MTPPPPDGSRDRRIEDLSNLWLIHPAARWLLPRAIGWRVTANMASLGGLAVGIAAAEAYLHWPDRRLCAIGLLLSLAWLVMDGLDGMIARATRTASPVGRILDGVCDHGVFILIYVALAGSIGTASAWLLAIAAGAAHALQSMLYEGERARFHRRLRGLPPPAPRHASHVPVYDSIAGALDRLATAFDAALAPRVGDATRYGDRAVAPMRLLALQSANVRVLAIFIACWARDPRLFWWFELIPLSALLVAGLLWHRRVEAKLLSQWRGGAGHAMATGHGR